MNRSCDICCPSKAKAPRVVGFQATLNTSKRLGLNIQRSAFPVHSAICVQLCILLLFLVQTASIMDPLSIGSAVVGLIATAARVAPMLHHFVSHARDAPKSASQILEEMNSITSALEQLQVYLMGAYRTNAARRSMLSLRNIVATLTACVTTYSDLEFLVRKCMSDGKVKAFKWVMNESDVGGLLDRVQAHKLSLVFMLTILQW